MCIRDSTSAPNSVPSAANIAATSAQLPGTTAVLTPQTDSAVAHERVVAQTDVLKLTFDTEGGSLVRAEFLSYTDMADKAHDFVSVSYTHLDVYKRQKKACIAAADTSASGTVSRFRGTPSATARSADTSMKLPRRAMTACAT